MEPETTPSETTTPEASAEAGTPTVFPAKATPKKPKAAKKPVAKKAAVKAKQKITKGAIEAKAKAATKPKKDGMDARRVSGLRRFQVRTLKALNESIDQLTIGGIAKKAKISHTMVVMGLGTIDAKLLKAHDKKMGFPSLLTLGHVKVVEIENITAIQITASGKKALATALTAAGGKLPKVKAAAAA